MFLFDLVIKRLQDFSGQQECDLDHKKHYSFILCRKELFSSFLAHGRRRDPCTQKHKLIKIIQLKLGCCYPADIFALVFKKTSDVKVYTRIFSEAHL